MNRRGFFKFLGIGAAVVAAPVALCAERQDKKLVVPGAPTSWEATLNKLSIGAPKTELERYFREQQILMIAKLKFSQMVNDERNRRQLDAMVGTLTMEERTVLMTDLKSRRLKW